MHLPEFIKQKIKDCLRVLAPDARTYLYGSQARGEARQDSDIDLLILLPDDCEGKRFAQRKIDISGALYDLSLSLGVDIAPLIIVPKVFFARKTPFSINVMNDRIEL